MAVRRDMRRFGSELITRYFSAFTLENDDASGKVRVRIDDTMEREVEALKMLVHVYVVRRPGLAVVQHGQKRVIADLFEFYFGASDPDRDQGGDRRLFPPGTLELLEAGTDEAALRARIVTDLISGLTETTALELHQRLMGGWTAPTLDATADRA